MAEDYASLSHYGKAYSLLHSLNEAYRQAGQPVNPIFEGYEDIYSKLSDMGSFTVSKPNHDVFVPLSVHKNNNNKPEMLYVTANFNGNDIKCNYDTGASGSLLTYRYYKKSENLFDGKTATNSLHSAGVGGISVVKTIPSPWSYTISGKKYDVTSIPIVVSPAQNEDYDCLMGLPLLMSHKKFVLNFNEMWIRFDD